MSDELEMGEIGWEGWDTRDTDTKDVRRFAKPPYRWVTVRRARFSRQIRERRDDPPVEEAGL